MFFFLPITPSYPHHLFFLRILTFFQAIGPTASQSYSTAL
jgi:hypothetical protein